MTMKKLIWVWLCLAARGQEPPQPEPAQDQTTPKVVSESPDAAPEPWVTGTLDFGYRWRTGPAGNANVYRSLVDVGEGPKLLNGDITIMDPTHRWFDQIDAHAANWGDDPYTTLSVAIRKRRVYEFTSTYRNLAYFNNVPSFANPLLDRGVLSSERTYDTRSRINSFELSLLPSSRVVPYVAYDRSSIYGNGVTPFVSDQNEYPVPFQTNMFNNNMRGGVRFELSRYHMTIEEGGTTFHDDQTLFQSLGASNPGNRDSPFLGTSLSLNGVSQTSAVRGSSVYTKVLGTAQPTEWLALYGQYLYTRPQNDTNYQQVNSGNFVLQSQALFFTSQQSLLSSAAQAPHQAGNAGAEVRLHPRLRLVTSWLTDRIHVSGDSTGLHRLSESSGTRLINAENATELRNDYNHVDGEVFWDVTRPLTLRGGYRYEWGRTSTFVMPPAGLASQDIADFRRNVIKAGFSYRMGTSISVSGDVEGAGTDSAYFRTSLYRYQRGRLQGFYQATPQLTFSAAFSAINNQNPASSINLDYFGTQSSGTVLWNPAGTKGLGFQGTYTYASTRSSISFLVPQTLERDQSRYNDRAHSIQGMLDFALPRLGKQAKLSAGGNFFISSGSRPTNYFQPVGKLILPLTHVVAWITEWAYYGYAESLYSYENFRTHLVTTGFRLTF